MARNELVLGACASRSLVRVLPNTHAAENLDSRSSLFRRIGHSRLQER
jgi:hypothetical protein